MTFFVGFKTGSNRRNRYTRPFYLTTSGVVAICLGSQAAQAQEVGVPAQAVEQAALDLQVDPDRGPTKAANTDEETVNVAGGKEEAPVAELLTENAPDIADEGITVTGTRIVRDGYNAPTPVSVLGSAEIQAQAPANLADFVNTLPSIAGSSTPSNSSGSLSNGLAGINAVNLRSLGTNRTLVLLDGQRSVASTVTGSVDINTFPQELVERVEVVTGGASAAYGSDAVGGVVNFILNRNFKGLKATAEYGITHYGDTPNYKLTVAGGHSFFGDRLTVLVSGEYFSQEGKHSIDRDWNDKGYFQINNPAYTPTNGQPFRLVGSGIGPSQMTPGGLVTTGPLRGTYFGAIDPATGRATTGQLTFGAVSNPWMVGGDWEYTLSNHVGTNSLSPDEERIALFGRVSFEISPAFEVFGQVAYNRYEGLSYYQQTPNVGNVTIRADNAFLPADVKARIAAYNATNGTLPDITSLTIGTSNAGIPAAGSNNLREVTRYVIGAKGGFSVLKRDWNWDLYYQKGIADLHEALTNTWNNARMALAQDAVLAPAGNAAGIPAGTIVCRSTLTTPSNGCVPLNRIGIGGATQDAINYIFTDGQPYRDQKIQQDVAALTFSGTLLDLPAGPVSLAFGGEYRKERVNGFVEAQYQAGWLYGNYLVNKGQYDVKEGFLEVAIPVFTGLDLNGAFRYTRYSTSGDVKTWKVGATFQPIEDIKIRGTVSHDIRAPNLNELFAAGTARTNTVNVPLGSGVFRADEFVQNQTGSTDLTPEIADSWSVGAVVTPRFIPGLAFSVDYYSIDISDAIGSVSAQTTVDLCYEQDIQQFCDNISFAPGGTDITFIKLVPFNFANQKAKGLDIEASYRLSLADLSSSIPGNLSLRALFTHYIENLSDNGIDFPNDSAGTNTGNGPPSWVYRVSATYDVDPVVLNLVGRGVSSGVYNTSFIECTTNCPTSTVEHRTINDNSIEGAFYVDASMTIGFEGLGAEGELQLSVRNLLDTDPVLVGNGPDGNNATAYPQTSRNFYDTFGRTYRVGIRLKF